MKEATEINPEKQNEARVAYREIHQRFYEKTAELFGMYEKKINGLEDKVRNPAYGINGNGNEEQEWLYDFPSFYQIEGVQFLMDQKRVLIADEMGVGKTAQAIAGKIALENKLGRKVKTLVVCPNRQVQKEVWEKKLRGEYITAERLKDIKIESIDSDNGGYKKADIDDADIVIIDYHALSFSDKKPNNIARKRLKQKLIEVGFEYVVLDEVHNVKNYSSANRFSHVYDIVSKAEYVAMLSGTPIPTSLKDTYALIALLKPQERDENGNVTGYKNVEEVATVHSKTPSVIGAILRTSRLERKLEDVAILPPKTEEYIPIDEISDKQQEIYQSIYEDDSLTGLQKIQRLQQALINPSIFDKSLEPTSPKFEKLDEIVNGAITRGEKIVIYSPMFKGGVINTLTKKYRSFGAVYMDGSNLKTRDKVIEKFQKNPNARVMVMNKVGGEGIPLTAANNLVFLWEPFSPGEKRQVIGRVWRPGQKKPVRVYTLNVNNTIDDGIREFLKKKKVAIEYVEKGLPLTEEQKSLLSAGNENILEKWLRINRRYLYTPSQITGQLINRTKGKPEERVVKTLNGKFGEHLAKCLSESWEDSILENCANVYSTLFKTLEQKVGRFDKIVDIASGFGGLSHSLQRRGIYNVDADKHHFNSPYASKENTNLVGKMTELPIKENESFDFALCSMALDILPSTSVESGRARAIAETNRVLRNGGYYIFTIPGPTAPDNDEKIREGMQKLGFEVVPELTGFVKSKDKKINSNLYFLTAKKISNVSDMRLEFLADNFKFNDSKTSKEKGNAQRRRGKATEFEFIRQDGSSEDLTYALQKFLEERR
jgi:superfamily II DNA or RNA helicase/ubiquinone/menaquinone biosynthesis C-methylase UbiE